MGKPSRGYCTDVFLIDGFLIMLYNYNYGIGVARILAGFLVVLWHVQNFAIGVEEITGGEVIVSFAVTCANLFALISGWLGINSKWRIGKYLRLWIQVVGTGFVVLCAAHFIFGLSVSRKDFLSAFLPVLTNQYWYFTAYTGVFFLMPIINAGLKAMDDKTLLGMAVGLGIVGLLYTAIPGHDPLLLNDGYSAFWLVILYVSGALLNIKRERFQLGAGKWFLFAVMAGTATALQVYAVNHISFVSELFRGKATLLKYTSITTTFCSICLFMGCVNLRIKNRFHQTAIRFLSPVSFGVYLIHVQPVVWRKCWSGTLKCFGTLPLCIDAIAVVLFAALLFLMLAFVERGRMLVEKKFVSLFSCLEL